MKYIVDKYRNLIRDASKIFKEGGTKRLLKRIASRIYRRTVVRKVLTPLLLRPAARILDQTALRDESDRVWQVGEEQIPGGDPSYFNGKVDEKLIPSHIQNPTVSEYEFEDPFVSEIRAAYLVGSLPFGVTETAELILDTIIHTQNCGISGGSDRISESISRTIDSNGPHFTKKVLSDSSYLATNSQKQLDSVCLLTSGWNNYGHWMTEHLLKLRAIEKYEQKTGKRPTLVLEPEPPEYKKQHLRILGYEDDWIEWTHDLAQITNLVVPSYPHPTPTNTEWLRSRILPAAPVNITEEELSSRVYISRRKANKKNVLNESEVISELSKYGFKDYVLEDMHVADQALLFANAELVVGPTGSGFTNLMYSCDVSFIELVPHKVGTVWYKIGKMMDFDQEYIFCETKNVRDLIVDTTELAETVERHL